MPTLTWTQGETLLALGLAHELEWRNPSSHMLAVLDLSRLLSRGSLHPGRDLPANFRNPNAVKMKVSNLVWHYSGGERGLRAGAGQDLSLVRLYQTDPTLVVALARELRSILESDLEHKTAFVTAHE